VKRLAWAAAVLGLVGFSAWAYFALRPQEVPFVLLEEGASLAVPPGLARPLEPGLIILASQEDMQLVQPYTFPEPLANRIQALDFEKNFVILAQRSQKAGGLITLITRQAGTVLILTTDIPFGPGNYVLETWTQPYELILIEKNSAWGQEIHFVLRRETQGLVGEASHFVP